MDRAGDQVLAHAAFPAEQHRRICRGHAFDRRQHLLHFRRARHNIRMAILLAEGLAQRTVLFLEARVVQLLAHDHAHLGQRKRLEHVIAGARFHRFDCGLHRAERGHDHDRQGGVLPFRSLQKFQPAQARQLEVGEHQMHRLGGEQLQRGLGIAGRERFEAILAEVQLEQTAHFCFIFDDENGRHFVVGRCQSSVFGCSSSLFIIVHHSALARLSIREPDGSFDEWRSLDSSNGKNRVNRAPPSAPFST